MASKKPTCGLRVTWEKRGLAGVLTYCGAGRGARMQISRDYMCSASTVARTSAIRDANPASPFLRQLGMMPLTGTSDAAHMRADLEVFDFRLAPEEIERIERLF